MNKYIYAIAVLSVVGAFWAWGAYKYNQGRGIERSLCESKKLTADKKGRTINDIKHREITILPDPDLDDRLRIWFRD